MCWATVAAWKAAQLSHCCLDISAGIAKPKEIAISPQGFAVVVATNQSEDLDINEILRLIGQAY